MKWRDSNKVNHVVEVVCKGSQSSRSSSSTRLELRAAWDLEDVMVLSYGRVHESVVFIMHSVLNGSETCER